MKIFGMVDDEHEVVETPFGEPCLYCDEPIEADDTGFVTPMVNALSHVVEAAYHRSCFLVTFVGSVGHQTGKCSCFGGDFDDPPGMSKREAAQEAVRIFEGKNLWN